jgi:hypothetical protein
MAAKAGFKDVLPFLGCYARAVIVDRDEDACAVPVQVNPDLATAVVARILDQGLKDSLD